MTRAQRRHRGNLSLRDAEGFLSSPHRAALRPLQAGPTLVAMGMDGRTRGESGAVEQWRIHRDIYRARPDAGARSLRPLALRHRNRLPPTRHPTLSLHDARFGGATIRCARNMRPLALQALSEHAPRRRGTIGLPVCQPRHGRLRPMTAPTRWHWRSNSRCSVDHYLESMRLGPPQFLAMRRWLYWRASASSPDD